MARGLLEVDPLIDPAPLGASRAVEEGLWFLRVNPLRRMRLADPRLQTAVRQLVAAEFALAEVTAATGDRLYDLIGAATGPQERHRLVGLRRAVHNDRAPGDDPLPPEAEDWARARIRRDDLEREVVASVTEAASRERRTLADQLSQPDLRRALDLVAPEVATQAERYRDLVASGEPVSSRHRKSERGLLQYLTRAAVRTSPLSRFTAVSLAVPHEAGVDPSTVGVDGAIAHVSLDRVMLAYVLGGLAPDGAWCGVAPTSRIEGDKLYFLGAGPSGTTRMAASLSGLVAVLVDTVRLGPRPLNAVVERLADSTGDRALASGFLDQALDKGLVCRYAQPEDAWVDVDRMLVSSPAVAECTSEVRAALADLADRAPGDRGAVAALDQSLAALSARAGRPARVAAHEDYVASGIRVDPTSWQQALADLGPAVGLLSAFDWLHDVRAVLPGLFVKRFGSGGRVQLVDAAGELVDDVTRIASVLAESGADPDAVTHALGDLDPAGRETMVIMGALRERITAEVDAALDEAVANGRPEVHLDVFRVRDLLRGLPRRLREVRLNYGVLVQPHGDRLVLNDGLPGHGVLFSRFLEADAAAGGEAIALLRDRLHQVYGEPGVVLVEDRSLYGLNVNAHPQVLDDVLHAEDWHGLTLRHDPHTGRLVVEDPRREEALRVLPLGGGHPGLYPPALSVASSMTMTGRLYNSFPDQWYAAHPERHSGTLALPGTTVGSVVLARRRWYPGPDLDEVLRRGLGDGERLAELTRWRGRHGVPDEVVVKTVPRDTGPSTSMTPESQEFRLRNKPQYLDLASAVTVHALPRMLERRDADSVTYLEEAVPGVEAGPHAVEWVVEVTQRPGGEFQYGAAPAPRERG